MAAREHVVGASCVTYGNSGSPLILDVTGQDKVTRFTWAGPLSMSKGTQVTLLPTPPTAQLLIDCPFKGNGRLKVLRIIIARARLDSQT